MHIHLATRLDLVSFLVQQVTDSYGRSQETKVLVSTRVGRPMIELLPQRGGNVNAKDKLGETPLFLAMKKRSCEEYNFKTLMDYVGELC